MVRDVATRTALTTYGLTLRPVSGWRVLTVDGRIEGRWSSGPHWASFSACVAGNPRLRGDELIAESHTIAGERLTLAVRTGDRLPQTLRALERLMDAFAAAP